MMHKEKSNFIFGIRTAIEAIHFGKEIDKILIQKGLGNELFAELKKLIQEHNIPHNFVPVEKLNRITGKNHQGIICFLSEITFHHIENFLPGIYEAGKTPLLLVLDKVTDVRNFGAICRTAECAGVHAIIIPSRGSAQVNADAVKTSAGALQKIPVCREENLKETLLFLRESGLQIVACTEKTNDLYYSVDLTKPTAIIMGSEEDGISAEYLKLSDVKAKIPLLGEIGSLNVSVACGILLYEAVKQRQ
jgi:23S rRNA (guanosine2251-2'-O)-methyltransferase